MLDEKARRKETFDEANSVAVRLADGQEWYFPKPWIEVYASFHGDVARSLYSALTYGPELDRLVGALSACEDNGAFLCGAATLGAYLLRQQYDLAEDELDRLFSFRVGEPESWAWTQDVAAVASGLSGPKVSCGGGS